MLVSGCASPRYASIPAKGISNAKTIYIIENPETTSLFLEAMKDWLYEHKYDIQLLPPSSETSQYEWVLTYTALRSWDLAVFLRDATIRAFNKGTFSGDSKFYSDNNLNFSKYGGMREKVGKMMGNLFSVDKNVVSD